MTEEENKKQCICRVYYPQKYNNSVVYESRERLNNLFLEGWTVDRVIQNNEYFADYILKKEVRENDRLETIYEMSNENNYKELKV